MPDPLKNMASSGKRTLSVCMIVKNEAKILARCLESVFLIADETVVVDTGSDDDSVEIAKKFGCRVIISDWRNDFSYSRNISIKDAFGDWILWVDADDVIPQESVAFLKAMKQERPDKVIGLVVRNQKPGDIGSEFIQARMFPNRSGISFEGRIHEQIMPSALRSGFKMDVRPVVIEHHGYADPQEMQKKAERNIALLLEMYDPKNPEPVSAIELADSYTILEDWDNAQEWYSRILAIHGIGKKAPVIASQANMGLGNIFNKKEKHPEAAYHFKEAHTLCPDRVDVLYCYAVAQELDGDTTGAIKTLNAIFTMENRPVQVGVDYRQTIIKSYLRLARLYWENGMRKELFDLIDRALKERGERPEIQNMAGTAYYRYGKTIDALHRFEESLNIAIQGNIDAYVGLCVIYSQAGKKEHIQRTADQIESLFSHMPRYWALCRILNIPTGDKAIPDSIKQELVKKEVKHISMMFNLK